MRASAVLLVFLTLVSNSGFGAGNASNAMSDRNRFKWKDAQGVVHYDDMLPAEARQFGYDIVNKSGVVIKHIDRMRTPEEQKAFQEAEAKRAAEKQAADEQAQRDKQLLTAYPTEQDLQRSHQAQLDSLNQEAHATQVSLESQEKSLTEMLGRAADLERTGKPIPPALSKQIEKQRGIVTKQKDYLENKKKERAATEQRFADELAHYRELREKTPLAPATP